MDDDHLAVELEYSVVALGFHTSPCNGVSLEYRLWTDRSERQGFWSLIELAPSGRRGDSARETVPDFYDEGRPTSPSKKRGVAYLLIRPPKVHSVVCIARTKCGSPRTISCWHTPAAPMTSAGNGAHLAQGARAWAVEPDVRSVSEPRQ